MPLAGGVHIIGGGLAGCEAAWQIAARGIPVRLSEMRPARRTPVHKTDGLAELVCSNSFRGDKLDNAVGLLKEEMRRLGSLIMRAAEASRVPAGAALAVDRARFSVLVTDALAAHPLVTIVRTEVEELPDGPDPVIVATGPLTSDTLSARIAEFVGREHLSFYDAISPIVLAESLDASKIFRASRWDRSLGPPAVQRAPIPAGDPSRLLSSPGTSVEMAAIGATDALGNTDEAPSRRASSHACGIDDGQGDYLNCPLTKEDYQQFYSALVSAESATIHDFDKSVFFEGCLPIEVMARRGVDTLRFGPMKPVGLIDPRTGRQPYAVVQLRQDTLAGDHFSLVGFQTQLKWGEQARVLRLIPGLERAEFVRFGIVHRNTYINGPTVLEPTWQTRSRPGLLFAGQVSGVEGYVESAASGLLAGLTAVQLVQGHVPIPPPRTTALGALSYYVARADARHYAPTNITFGILEPMSLPARERGLRKTRLSERALAALDHWRAQLDQASGRGTVDHIIGDRR